MPDLQIHARVKRWGCTLAFTKMSVSVCGLNTTGHQQLQAISGSLERYWVTDDFPPLSQKLASCFFPVVPRHNLLSRLHTLPVGWCKEVGPGRGGLPRSPCVWRSVNTVAALSWLKSHWTMESQFNHWRACLWSNDDCLLTNLLKH